MEFHYQIPQKRSVRVKPGEFKIAAIGLQHAHIYNMAGELVKAGAVIKWAYDAERSKVDAFTENYPGSVAAESVEQILNDPEIKLVISAAIPCDREAIGAKVMRAGKDFMADKPGFTTFEQLEDARRIVAETGRKYFICYSERVQSEAGIVAGELIRQGAIGRVLQLIGTGPHLLNAPSRPDWFWEIEKNSSLINDIGSHQVEQFLAYTGAKDARVNFARVENFAHPEHPGFYDFGEFSLTGDNGASGYFRLDWFTSKGVGTWSDGRVMLLGTEGHIELRKYANPGVEPKGEWLYLTNNDGSWQMRVADTCGQPYFFDVIDDCLDRTENAMTQEHTFMAMEIALRASKIAEKK